jgi:hypothetical protein
MAKNYFAIVHRENGNLLCNRARLPIYYRKDVAIEDCESFNSKDYIVQPIDIKELERLVLSQKNNKAK